MLYSGGSGRNRRLEYSTETQVLQNGATYAWWIDLHVPATVEDLMRLLSPEERSRATRVANNEVYREFVITRSTVRLLLARYIGCAPEQVPLVPGRYGKPAIDDAAIGIEFNSTHSHGLALVCFSSDRRVGVDLEHICSMADLDDMGMLTLTARERLAIAADPAPLEAFFRCWVRKEAVVKAAGVGLSASLCEIEVTPSDGPVAVQLNDAHDRQAKYEVISLEAPRGYKAAIACERSVGKLVVNTWSWN
jgi:4'-phosphopantetheinyl transferase